MSSLLLFFQYIKNSNEDEFFEVGQCFTGVYYIDTDEITGFFLLPKLISSSSAVKILFLSIRCEDIGVAMVTNIISQHDLNSDFLKQKI